MQKSKEDSLGSGHNLNGAGSGSAAFSAAAATQAVARPTDPTQQSKPYLAGQSLSHSKSDPRSSATVGIRHQRTGLRQRDEASSRPAGSVEDSKSAGSKQTPIPMLRTVTTGKRSLERPEDASLSKYKASSPTSQKSPKSGSMSSSIKTGTGVRKAEGERRRAAPIEPIK